jgi:hypothetical protein
MYLTKELNHSTKFVQIFMSVGSSLRSKPGSVGLGLPIRIWIRQKDAEPTGSPQHWQVKYFFYVPRIKVRLPGCLLVRYLRTEMVTVERMLRSGEALSQLLSAQSFLTLQ